MERVGCVLGAAKVVGAALDALSNQRTAFGVSSTMKWPGLPRERGPPPFFDGINVLLSRQSVKHLCANLQSEIRCQNGSRVSISSIRVESSNCVLVSITNRWRKNCMIAGESCGVSDYPRCGRLCRFLGHRASLARKAKRKALWLKGLSPKG